MTNAKCTPRRNQEWTTQNYKYKENSTSNDGIVVSTKNELEHFN